MSSGEFPRPHPATAFRTVAGEAVIITITDGMQHHLDAVGTFIWELLIPGKMGVDRLAQEVCSEFDVDYDTAWADLQRFLCDLEDKGMIQYGQVQAI